MSSRAAKTYSARVKAKFVVVTVVFFASICLVFWFLVYLSSAFSFVSRMSPIRRKGRFVSRDVDKRKTFFRDNFAGVGRKTAVIKKGVRMIAAKSPPKEATCGDLSTSLSASSSDSDEEGDESIFPDSQDDGEDGECFRRFIFFAEFRFGKRIACLACKQKGS